MTKMDNSGDHTHREFAVDPKTFRAKATGIGQSQDMSLRTGANRAQRVADTIPEHCRGAVPTAEGYPEPLPTYDPSTGTSTGRGY